MTTLFLKLLLAKSIEDSTFVEAHCSLLILDDVSFVCSYAQLSCVLT